MQRVLLTLAACDPLSNHEYRSTGCLEIQYISSNRSAGDPRWQDGKELVWGTRRNERRMSRTFPNFRSNDSELAHGRRQLRNCTI